MLDWPTSSPQMMTMFGFAAWAVASPGAAIHIVSSNISNKTTLFIWASIGDMGRVCPRYVCPGPHVRHRTLVLRLTRPIVDSRPYTTAGGKIANVRVWKIGRPTLAQHLRAQGQTPRSLARSVDTRVRREVYFRRACH